MMATTTTDRCTEAQRTLVAMGHLYPRSIQVAAEELERSRYVGDADPVRKQMFFYGVRAGFLGDNTTTLGGPYWLEYEDGYQAGRCRRLQEDRVHA